MGKEVTFREAGRPESVGPVSVEVRVSPLGMRQPSLVGRNSLVPGEGT